MTADCPLEMEGEHTWSGKKVTDGQHGDVETTSVSSVHCSPCCEDQWLAWPERLQYSLRHWQPV